jgi:hypothetical protein
MRRTLVVGYLGLAGTLLTYHLLWQATHARWLTSVGWLLLFLGMPWIFPIDRLAHVGQVAVSLGLWVSLCINFTLVTEALRRVHEWRRRNAA